MLSYSLLLALAASVLATPAPSPAQPEKRQDYSALIQLASEAGVPLPTNDPSLLLSIAPIAAKLASYLPTAPVLSVLETAAPSGFLSKIVHDPAYASSFESEFAAGHSPSWFLALPTDVKSYLHTYSGYAPLATQIGSAEGIIATASEKSASEMSAASASAASAGGSAASIASQAGIGSQTGTMTTGTGASARSTGSTSGAMSTGSAASASQSSSSAAASTSASVAGAGSSTAGTTPSSTASTAGAARETGVMAAGVAAAVGVLGLAMAL